MKMSQRSRDIQIKFRVSEEEAEQLRKKVEQSGKSMQEYLLGCALNKPMTINATEANNANQLII